MKTKEEFSITGFATKEAMYEHQIKEYQKTMKEQQNEIEMLQAEKFALSENLRATDHGYNTLKADNQKMREALEDFKNYGTRHDINPTGQFRDCGCFDSCRGDHCQGYIRSQDSSVRERAREALLKLDKLNK